MSAQTPQEIMQQATRSGARIENSSFDIIDAEIDGHAYDDLAWPVVRRLIHASGDFEFNGLTEFHPQAVAAGIEALRRGAPIVCDVEMIRAGLSGPRLAHFGSQVHQFISDEELIEKARQEETTRAVQAMRKARDLGLLDGAIVGVGNAPTALLEVMRQVRENEAKPALIIGMPVGFVSALESKDELAELDQAPWMITRGRKGGSTLVVAAVHALMALAVQ